MNSKYNCKNIESLWIRLKYIKTCPINVCLDPDKHVKKKKTTDSINKDPNLFINKRYILEENEKETDPVIEQKSSAYSLIHFYCDSISFKKQYGTKIRIS